MKKFGLIIIGLCSLFFALNFTSAKEYEYTNLDIIADILEDGTINVKEYFTANFFVDKHGMIRSIPLNYSVEGKIFHIDVSNINVVGKFFSTSKQNGNIEIKIGDSNKTVIGEQSYPISYTTYGLIRNFSGLGFSELYWNLVGYDFDTNINKVHATINLPKSYTGFTADDFLITTDGTSKTIEGFSGVVDRSQGDKIIITYDEGLPAYHGITLSTTFPNDYFQFDHKKQESLLGSTKDSLFETILDRIFFVFMVVFILILYCISLCPPIAFIAMFIGAHFLVKKIKKKITLRRYKKGGLLKGKLAKQFPVIVQYTPPTKISSAEASLLLNRRAEPISLISLIYKRATEGLISIHASFKKDKQGNDSKKIKSITIKKNGEINDSAPSYEKKFFNSFLSSNIKTLSSSSINMSIIHLKELELYGVQKKWFAESNVETFFKFLPFILVFITFVLSAILTAFPKGDLYIKIFVIPAILAIIYSIYYLKKRSDDNITQDGAKILSHILGYREFLQKCDENQLRSFLKEDPLFLNNALPYATIFGIESDLIKKILPIMNELNIGITWYDGDISCIDNFVSGFDSYTPPMPSSGGSGWSGDSGSYSSDSGFSSGSSSGGGFSSGGGGGGGGGRSW